MNVNSMISDMVKFGQKCGTTWFWNFSDEDPNADHLKTLKTAQEDGAVACMVGLYGQVMSHESIRFHVMEGWKNAWLTLFRDETERGQTDMNRLRPIFTTDPSTHRITRVTWGLRTWTARWDGEDVEFYLLAPAATDVDTPMNDRTHYLATKTDGTPLGREVDLEDPWVSEL